MPSLVFEVLSNIGYNSIDHVVRFLEDMTNRYGNSITERAPNAKEE